MEEDMRVAIDKKAMWVQKKIDSISDELCGVMASKLIEVIKVLYQLQPNTEMDDIIAEAQAILMNNLPIFLYKHIDKLIEEDGVLDDLI